MYRMLLLIIFCFCFVTPGEVWHYFWQLPHLRWCEGSRGFRKWNMGCYKGTRSVFGL